MKTVEKGVAIALLITCLAMAWFMGPLLALKGPAMWILRIGLALLAIIAFAGYWFLRSRQTGEELADVAPTSESQKQVDAAFREAREKLKAANKDWAGSLAGMPAVLIVGAPGSAKTTIMAQCGLEPELLSGQAFREGVIVPTPSLNIWVAGQTLFADVSGKLLADESGRKRLLARLRPPKVSAVLGRGTQPPRAVILCVDGEMFLEGAAAAAQAQAQEIRETLREAARDWGVHVPVYVVATKMDRIAHFAEFAATLSAGEAGEVLGATLPARTEWSEAAYAEEQARVLTQAYEDLFHSLASVRPALLAREHDETKLGAVYQFAREFRKMRDRFVGYLVEICRPSQIAANPYVRGFYFTGVRPIVVAGPAPEAAKPSRQSPLLAGATGMFQQTSVPTPETVSPERTGRRIPQWVFLGRWFRDVLLQDGAAKELAGAGVAADRWRRVLLGVASFGFFVLSVAWLVSFLNNRALKNEFLTARQALATANTPSLDSLEKLDALRDIYSRIEHAEQNGAPMSMRWGLYAGSSLKPAVSKAYFDYFKLLLFQRAQASVLGVTARPEGSSLGPKPVYDALKAYLITTSNADKSRPEFLAPVLTDHWARGPVPDPRAVPIAYRQFDFYARILPSYNPYPGAANSGAVDTARRYLSKFSASEALYQAMLAKASEQFAAIRFNQQFPGSAETVRNMYPVAGAFTQGGWGFMTDAIANPDRYFSGERWVMGDQAFAGLDTAKLKVELLARYQADFARTWREFLRATSVNPYVSVGDAATKLTTISGNQSPLLMVLCVTSRNTAKAAPDVAKIFQSAQMVTPDGCQDQLSSAGNKPYADRLIDLQAKLQQLSGNLGSEPFRNEASSSAANALVGARQTAQGFRIDQEGQIQSTVQKLLEAPIDYASSVIAGAETGPVNEAAAGACKEFRGLMSKYPFDPKSTQQATVADVNGFFQPGQGLMWKLYGEHLSKLMPRNGNDFSSSPSGRISVTGPFLGFFRNIAGVSNAFYKGGGAQPQLTFGLKPQRMEGIERVTLSINGQTQSGAGGESWQFAWPGAGPQEVKLSVKVAGGTELAYPSYSGLWAVFDFFSRAKWEPSGADASVEWMLTTSGGPVTLSGSGKPVIVRLDLSMNGAPPVLRPGYFRSLSCPPAAASSSK